MFLDIVSFIECDVRGIGISDHRDVRHFCGGFGLRRTLQLIAVKDAVVHYACQDNFLQIDLLGRYFSFLPQFCMSPSSYILGRYDCGSNLPNESGCGNFGTGVAFTGRYNSWIELCIVTALLGPRGSLESEQAHKHGEAPR